DKGPQGGVAASVPGQGSAEGAGQGAERDVQGHDKAGRRRRERERSGLRADTGKRGQGEDLRTKLQAGRDDTHQVRGLGEVK
ncbi:hypothetical protein THAOC_23511, partial [Thalassiosira oceanica]